MAYEVLLLYMPAAQLARSKRDRREEIGLLVGRLIGLVTAKAHSAQVAA